MLKQKSSNLHMICSNSEKFWSNSLCTLHWHAFTNALHKRVIWNLPRANVCEAALKRWLKHLFAAEKNILMLNQKSSNVYMICCNSVKKYLSNFTCTLHWHAFTDPIHKRVIWYLPRVNVCGVASNTWLKHLLAVEKSIYAQAKIVKSLQQVSTQ